MLGSVRALGPDVLVSGGMRLLTPPLRAVYALLIHAGLLVIED
ncbi:hypothetical protein ORI20_17310 [Mycobacterium sp. CVI_P3]|uniref:Uncharacterized protein n=1 Tax=Mycobacterium pinniadriaticum TaxID=2994102 RepID=A0ABT3SG22_9MYCO|nr:hypothetical protein [Mycobacterium pinniadriaticum]MCX2932039.1 hypothetical protein [Mycobacterium pinniadriaticum]MCX2938463.1 hypothetical protein [Mycobacterium pinniadriaticum]